MNYLIFDNKEPTNKELIAGYLMAGIPLFFCFYMAIWGFEQIADKKAENPNNMIRSCMFYDGTSKTRSGGEYHHLIIDGVSGTTFSSIPNVFYSYIRSKGFKNFDEFKKLISSNGTDTCYEVSYIKLDFILFKKVFIYDYHGIGSDNQNLTPTTQLK